MRLHIGRAGRREAPNPPCDSRIAQGLYSIGHTPELPFTAAAVQGSGR